MNKTRTVLAVTVLVGCLYAVHAGASPSDDLKEFRGIILNEWCHQVQPDWTPFANEHSLGCAMMPACYLSGYVLIVDDQTVFKLDKRGELLARRVLQKTNRQNNFQVVIYGRLSDTNHAGGAGAQHQHDEIGTEHQKIYVQTMEEAN